MNDDNIVIRYQEKRNGNIEDKTRTYPIDKSPNPEYVRKNRESIGRIMQTYKDLGIPQEFIDVDITPLIERKVFSQDEWRILATAIGEIANTNDIGNKAHEVVEGLKLIRLLSLDDTNKKIISNMLNTANNEYNFADFPRGWHRLFYALIEGSKTKIFGETPKIILKAMDSMLVHETEHGINRFKSDYYRHNFKVSLEIASIDNIEKYTKNTQEILFDLYYSMYAFRNLAVGISYVSRIVEEEHLMDEEIKSLSNIIQTSLRDTDSNRDLGMELINSTMPRIYDFLKNKDTSGQMKQILEMTNANLHSSYNLLVLLTHTNKKKFEYYASLDNFEYYIPLDEIPKMLTDEPSFVFGDDTYIKIVSGRNEFVLNGQNKAIQPYHIALELAEDHMDKAKQKIRDGYGYSEEDAKKILEIFKKSETGKKMIEQSYADNHGGRTLEEDRKNPVEFTQTDIEEIIPELDNKDAPDLPNMHERKTEILEEEKEVKPETEEKPATLEEDKRTKKPKETTSKEEISEEPTLIIDKKPEVEKQEKNAKPKSKRMAGGLMGLGALGIILTGVYFVTNSMTGIHRLQTKISQKLKKISHEEPPIARKKITQVKLEQIDEGKIRYNGHVLARYTLSPNGKIDMKLSEFMKGRLRNNERRETAIIKTLKTGYIKNNITVQRKENDVFEIVLMGNKIGEVKMKDGQYNVKATVGNDVGNLIEEKLKEDVIKKVKRLQGQTSMWEIDKLAHHRTIAQLRKRAQDNGKEHNRIKRKRRNC